MMNAVVSNPKFMYSAFSQFSNYDCMGIFDELGLRFKIERGNRVFPESDKAADVIDCLRKELKKLNVTIEYNTNVTGLLLKDGVCTGVKAKQFNSEKRWTGDEIIIATGGCSYPTTGSTGDGYDMARQAGLNVTKLCPALVPLTALEEWTKMLQGLSLRNVKVSFTDGKKELFSDFGEMMFTHFGVTGPVVLSASSYVARTLKKKNLSMSIDLKPALSEEQLDERICRDFEEFKNKQFKNSLDKLLPKKMIPVIIDLSGIDADKKVNEITQAERGNLVKLLKNLKITITGMRGFNEAIITQGGVDVKEINPSTMQSKKIPNLRFVGEVLDIDAVTGGFNLQVAWSTAYAAAQSIY